jgi:antibiotic biosynthesis monooxygenase (ABM) superfamily enzyme
VSGGAVRRFWRGWTTPENADVYQERLLTRILPAIRARAIPGYLGAEVWRRPVGDRVEFVTVMRFESLENVTGFMGADYEVAHVPPEAREVLASFDERSAHYEVLATDA